MSEVKYGEILGPEDEASRAKRVRSRFWTTLRKAARAVPFSEDLVAAYYCALDPATPHRVRGILLGGARLFRAALRHRARHPRRHRLCRRRDDPRCRDLGGRRPHRAAPPRGGARGAQGRRGGRPAPAGLRRRRAALFAGHPGPVAASSARANRRAASARRPYSCPFSKPFRGSEARLGKTAARRD